MKTIHKYAVKKEDEFIVNMPVGAKILTVQMQFGQPQMWAVIDDDEDIPLEPRHFRLAGTGHPLWIHDSPINGQHEYIGTIQMREGTLVFHLFEWINFLTAED